jgi:alkanesulfonate monooxygenase SsuD/methylene tetrahydromethanopterin reductase-like flavin-dependent oxidoreductase (luciferase family)
MTTFRPTRAPRGRLVRIGVVLDTRNAPGRLREIAAMCDGAGIDALWVRDHLAAPDGQPRLEAWTALTLASSATVRARGGAALTVAFRPVGTLAAMAGTLDSAVGGRLELSLSAGWVEREHRSFGFEFPDPEAGAELLESYARTLKALLAGDPVALGSEVDAELGVASPQTGGPPISVEALTPRQVDVAAHVADDVVLPAGVVKHLTAVTTRIRDACERVGRDPTTLGIALEVPVSIGRTRAEAEARAAGESLFEAAGPPSEVGIFGTLEQCQERVIEFAHAGISDLRCILPNNPDIHDVIAQLTAMAVGTVDVLTPGAPRSRDPDPPQTWGGRRSQPAPK